MQTDVYFYNFWWIRILVYKMNEKLWCVFSIKRTHASIYTYNKVHIIYLQVYHLYLYTCIYIYIIILRNRVDEDNMLRTVKKLRRKKTSSFQKFCCTVRANKVYLAKKIKYLLPIEKYSILRKNVNVIFL